MKKLIILILIAIGVSYISKSNEYIEIPSSSIRMRVIANSDSEEDQKKKVIVKSFLEEKLYEITSNSKKESDVDEIISSNKEKIDSFLKNKIEEQNLDVSFTSNYGFNYFPEKEFKGLSYKPGLYKSFVVTLGKGEGENWWCVLYPPLCLIDQKVSDYEYHYLIKDVLDKYN